MTSPLSPEAVAQMVADLDLFSRCGDVGMMDRDMAIDAKATITTLAAANATLRADAAKALQWAKEQHACADEYAAEVVALRASEAAANARADQARDAALVEAAAVAIARKGNGEATLDHPYDKGYLAACDSCATAILALRAKPTPGVTPKIEVKFTWAKGDEEFWVHLKSPDGKSAGFNLGNPKGMIATALLRAIAGGGDE